MNTKMFFFVEKTPGTFVRDKTFWSKSSWKCAEECQNVNNFCSNVRDRLDELFQSTMMGMKKSQNTSNKEKTVLRILNDCNKNVVEVVIVVVNDTCV